MLQAWHDRRAFPTAQPRPRSAGRADDVLDRRPAPTNGWRYEGVPTIGERLDWKGYRFEVVDMDGLRIDRVLIHHAASPAGPSAAD